MLSCGYSGSRDEPQRYNKRFTAFLPRTVSRGICCDWQKYGRPASERKSSLWWCAQVVRKEVLVFHGFDELVNQASRLLGEVGLTTRLGDSSARRAHRDHSFDVRITGILEELAL